jgi:hypothetical protein
MFCGTFPAQALYVGKRNAQWAAQKKSEGVHTGLSIIQKLL